jgi:hypothetical protein
VNFPTQEPERPDDTDPAGAALPAWPAPDPVPGGKPNPGAGPEPATGLVWHKSPDGPPVVPPSPADVATPAKRPRGLRLVALAVVMALGLGSAAAGAVLLTRELGRHATPAEVTAAAKQEVASRWRRLTAGEIFPPSIRYSDVEGNFTTTRLVGIAPAVSCTAAFDPSVARVMRAHGCVTVLRATYLDASGTLATTVAVAVMSSATAASKVIMALGGSQSTSGVRALSFSGTLADAFGDKQRADFGLSRTSGPYAFFFAAGYADGRIVAGPTDSDAALLLLGNMAMLKVEHTLTSHKSPCAMKDIRC